MSDDPKKDAEYIANMINVIKKEVCTLNVFAFVVNGNDVRWDQNTTNLVKIFEDNFGVEFWKHFAIVYT